MEAFLDKDKKVDVIKYGDTATEIPIDIYDGGNTVIVKDFEDYTITLEAGGVESELPVTCHPNQLVLTLPEEFYLGISRPAIGSFKSTLVKLKFTIDGQTMDDLRLNVVDSLINYQEVSEEDKLDNQPAQGPAIDTPKGSRKTAYDSVDSLFDETGYDN